MSNHNPSDFRDDLETAKVVRTAKRKGVRTLAEFVEACRDGGFERIGGVMVDSFTKSMVTQVWGLLEKHPKAGELIQKLATRFDSLATSRGGGVLGTRAAIADVVDRFWKISRPA